MTEKITSGTRSATGRAKHPHDSRRPESKAVTLGIEIYREEGNIEPLRASLSPRQRAFCEEYVVDFVGNAAAIRAGYSLNSVDQQAHLLLKNKGVATYIDYLTTSKEAKITAISPDYVIQKVTEIITKADSKDGDKLRGLELLARHLGMFIDRTEISGPDGEAIQMEQKTRESVNEFKEKIKRLSIVGGTDKKDV